MVGPNKEYPDSLAFLYLVKKYIWKLDLRGSNLGTKSYFSLFGNQQVTLYVTMN